jgi:hypothetical protein
VLFTTSSNATSATILVCFVMACFHTDPSDNILG